MAVVRIAFPTEKGGLDDRVYERLGRAPTFTIVEVDTETGEILGARVIENPGYRAASGAGVKAVQALAEAGAQVYAGPSPGPNAMAALQYLGIRVLSAPVGAPLREAVRRVLEELRES